MSMSSHRRRRSDWSYVHRLTRTGRRMLVALCVVDWLVFMLAIWLIER